MSQKNGTSLVINYSLQCVTNQENKIIGQVIFDNEAEVPLCEAHVDPKMETRDRFRGIWDEQNKMRKGKGKGKGKNKGKKGGKEWLEVPELQPIVRHCPYLIELLLHDLTSQEAPRLCEEGRGTASQKRTRERKWQRQRQEQRRGQKQVAQDLASGTVELRGGRTSDRGRRRRRIRRCNSIRRGQ